MKNMLCIFCLLCSGLAWAEKVEVADVDILHMSPEMKTFLDENIKMSGNKSSMLQQLVFLVFSPKFLNLEYDNSRTKTAAETFESRNGNCLSFTNMFVAMARYLGMNAQFQEVYNLPSWDKYGNVVVLNRHMNVAVEIRGKVYRIDFNPYRSDGDRLAAIVTDRRAKAQYYNNIGAERFRVGDVEGSFPFFYKSLNVDPELSFAWTNLGVAFSQSGKYERAEECYKEALKAYRFEYTAMSNLVKLYDFQGRPDKAKRYRRKVKAYQNRNPFYHFHLGSKAFSQGNYAEAVDHYRNAIRRKPKEHEFHFAVAKAYAHLGEKRKVEHSLRRATKYAPSNFDKDKYSQKLNLMASNQ